MASAAGGDERTSDGPATRPADAASPSERPARPYADSLEQLIDELEWVRLLLQGLVTRKWCSGALNTRGLSVPEDEILAFFGERLAGGTPDAPPPPPPAAGVLPELGTAGDGAGGELGRMALQRALPGLQRSQAAIRQRIEARVAATRAAGNVRLPLVELTERFGLNAEERELVRVLLAPELDPRFERACCFAWNDFTRKRPSVGFLLELLTDDLRRMERYRDALGASATLRRSGLVLMPLAEDRAVESFLSRTVLLAPRIVDFLRERDDVDESVTRFGHRLTPQGSLASLVLPEAVKQAALAVAGRGLSRDAEGDRGNAALVWGAPRSGKRSLVHAVAAEVGRPLWQIDLGALFSEQDRLVPRLWALLRDARLSDAVVLLDASEEVPAEGVPWLLATSIADVLRGCPGPVLITCPQRLLWLLKAWPELRELAVPLPSAEERLRLLQGTLAELSPLAEGLDLDDVAERFGLTGGALVRAARRARELADDRSPGAPLQRNDLHDSCRIELAHRLGTMADQVLSAFTWDDAVLPESTSSVLREMLGFARNRRFVLEKWGFRHLVPYGSGLSVLFTGPPGTGKTMVAGIIARELGMPLFRVDLSRIIDKYVGETEKKLARIFDEAEQSQAILLFDEADSLFAKRTGVHSSIDRYANLEVNFLLQRMESFDGVTILTTNLEKNLDEAFKRRLKFHIAFPFPDEEARIELWARMFPADAEVEELDFEELAEYELAGAHIKNAVLRAAMLAADAGRPIRMEDLHYSAGRETASMGKLVREE